MRTIIRDIWLCVDCTSIAVNGDASSLDYYYDEAEAATRLAEIEAGLERLPGLVPDEYDDSDPDSIQRECRACGYIHNQDHFKHVPETEDEDALDLCPECGSDSTEVRDSGWEEFSRRGCDCCDSPLAGSFTRFAQIVREDQT